MKNKTGPMRIIDIDAHFHEPKDWLKTIDPQLDEEIGPALHFREAARASFYPNPRVADLPEEERPAVDSEIIPLGLVEHLNLTEERHPECREESKDGPLYSAGDLERSYFFMFSFQNDSVPRQPGRVTFKPGLPNGSSVY